MVKTVIDASALLALLNGEHGADIVAQALPKGVMSAVNVCKKTTLFVEDVIIEKDRIRR